MGLIGRLLTYDGNGRLATATGPWGNATYSYDTLGNITKKAEGTRVVDLQYNAATNRISNVKDTAAGNTWRSYSHDASGNVTADGRHNFVYDMANQPISITGETSGTFVYDGNKKRIKQLVDGETIYSFYSQSGPLVGTYNLTTNEYTDYISAAGQTVVRVKNGIVTYPINDLLGTAIATVSATGTLLNDSFYNYTPWGEIHDSVPFAASGRRPAQQNLQGYTGHIEDKSGLIYMQARYYDPVIGRFLSTDPVDYADQLNLYAYVGNDPVNKTDPDGRIAQVIIPVLAVACAAHKCHQTLAESVGATTEIVAGDAKIETAKSRSGAKRRAARAAQRKKENPRVATSQPGRNMQGNKYGERNLRGQVKRGMDGKTEVGIQDGSKDKNNGPDHPPAVDVGNLKPGEQPGVSGQPRIQNEHKVKEEIR